MSKNVIAHEPIRIGDVTFTSSMLEELRELQSQNYDLLDAHVSRLHEFLYYFADEAGQHLNDDAAPMLLKFIADAKNVIDTLKRLRS